jgi:hypothetical protein
MDLWTDSKKKYHAIEKPQVPIDEIEQDEIIAELRQNVEHHEQQVHLIFFMICIVALILSLLLPWLYFQSPDVPLDTWNDPSSLPLSSSSSSSSFPSSTLSRWLVHIQAILAALTHIVAYRIAAAPPNESLGPYLNAFHLVGITISIVVTTVGYYPIIRQSLVLTSSPLGFQDEQPVFVDSGWLHYPSTILMGGTLFTAILSWIFRWDALSSMVALNDIQASKYKHKSL